jgi:microcystin-dependent protein
MGTQFLGELRLMAFNFAPRGWTMANGQTMSIQQNAALFSLFGTFYGGDGMRTFQLPNLEGRTPISQTQDNSFVIGNVGGEAAHTLLGSEMPAHNHLVNAATSATSDVPANSFLAGGGANIFNVAAQGGLSAMHQKMVGETGGGQPHDNMQPYLVMTWCISLTGIFPSRT